MLVKYLGTTYHQEKQQELPRTEFLQNGLFRITQPKFLNDKNETKFYTYIDEYSPADLEYAKKRFYMFNTGDNEEPTEKELINVYLKRSGLRYHPENFPTLLGFTDYSSVEEYKDAESARILKSVESFNKVILEILSCYIGIFSLTSNPINELMWTHYANEGKGIAVCFDEHHEFFKEFEVIDVSYNQEDRASISLVEGFLRVDGEKYKAYETFDSFNSIDIYKWLIDEGISHKDLSKRLFYTKTSKWDYEKEKRIIIPLDLCDEEKGEVVDTDIDSIIDSSFSSTLPTHREFCLKKIPFEAMQTVVFGYDISDISIKEVLKAVEKNPQLSHLRFKRAKMNKVTEKIELFDFA